MGKLDDLRAVCGFPFVVTSGYRCPEHNQSVSSTGASGPHTTGRAVDIRIDNSAMRFELLRRAIEGGFRRMGIAKTFIHIDDLGEAQGFPEGVFWVY